MRRRAWQFFLLLCCAGASCCPSIGETIVRGGAQTLPPSAWPPGLESAAPGTPVLPPEGWDVAVWEALSATIRRVGRPDLPLGRRPVAVFDFDNTCLRNDLGNLVFVEAMESLAFRFDAGFWQTIPADRGREDLQQAVQRVQARMAGGEGVVLAEDPDYLFWRKHLYRIYESMWAKDGDVAAAWLVSTFVGMTPEEVRTLTRRTLAKQLATPVRDRALREDPGDEDAPRVHEGLRFYAPIRNLVRALQRHGFDVWIVSASNQWSVEVGAARVGVPVDRVLGVRVARDAEGRLTTQAEPPVTHGPGKVEAIRRFTRREPSLVVGDGATDREMLAAAVDTALLIDKGEDELRDLAEREGWLVQPRFPVE